MTLNNNPRVTAEKRLALLRLRLQRVANYRWSRISVESDEHGVAQRMFINPYVKTKKADRILAVYRKEARRLEKFVNGFK